MISTIECIILYNFSWEALYAAPLVHTRYSWHSSSGLMSHPFPQQQPHVPWHPRVPPDHSDFTPELGPREKTAGAFTHYTLWGGWGKGGGFAKESMPRATRESSRRLESTYLQKARMKDNILSSRVLQRLWREEARNLEVQGLFWENQQIIISGKSLKDLSRVLGLPKCQGGKETHPGDLKSLHI